MTEQEWMASEDPSEMLWAVGQKESEHPDREYFGQAPYRVTPRKLRLFACACCRAVWHLLTDERSRRAVEVAERYADGEAVGKNPLGEAWAQAWPVNYETNSLEDLVAAVAEEDAADAASAWVKAGTKFVSPATQAALLREVVGNPWRPAYPLRVPEEGWAEPWLTPTVLSLAQAAYSDRDGGVLPVLADALSDAGCDSADLLSHLRGPGPHFRGCHVVDLILGKD